MLYEKLKFHLDLFFPRIKELNYFSYAQLQKNSYYNDFKIKDLNKYLNFYKKAKTEKYLVDSSVSYFTFEDIPVNIKKFNENSKIIVILRHPVKRAYSHYLMDIRMGYADMEFGTYLRNENKYPAHYHQYIRNSFYYQNISNYLKVFKREEICVIILEELNKDLLNLIQFLGIDPHMDLFKNEHKINENKKPKNSLAKLFQNNRYLTSKLKLLIPRYFIKRVKKHLYVKATETSISENDKKYLDIKFQEDIKKLSQLLNRDLMSIWK
jgi:hypothetical protein